jgi:branched-chain amino acid transport system ATP-binding protein
MTADRMLHVEGVTRAFGGLVAVRSIDLTIAPGEIVGLIGPNGAGKTTLFNLIAGATRPTSGRIVLDGHDISRLSPERRCALGIARTFQLVRIFPAMTVLDNVRVGHVYGRAGLRRRREGEAAAMATLERVGLATRAHMEAAHLTLVDRKRLELARAVATQPRLLLLDELLAGLNPSEVHEATALIRSIRDEGVAILLVEHLISAVLALADRLVCMAAGEKLADGLPGEVVKDNAVVVAYLGEEDHG